MISFKEYLAEARMAPLYHATSNTKALGIINDDILRVGRNIEPIINKRTVSLTRNFVFARNWLREQGWNHGGVIFELDQRKLAQRFKIIPFNYFAEYNDQARVFPTSKTYTSGKDYYFDNQFEEAVLSDIPKITKYITKVYVHKDEYSKILIKELDNLGIPVVKL